VRRRPNLTIVGNVVVDKGSSTAQPRPAPSTARPGFGIGRGYILGYSCEGEYRGRPFQARAYMEYVSPEFRTTTTDSTQ
jgi:hypothetical protein